MSCAETSLVFLASREYAQLDPLTRVLPAAMVPVLNVPLLEYALRQAAQSGWVGARVCICEFAHVFEEYFGEGEALGLSLVYSLESSPLADVQSLRRIWRDLAGVTVVLPANVLHDLDLDAAVALHRAQGAAMTRVECGGGQSTGAFVIETGLLAEANDSSLEELFARLRGQGRRVAYFAHLGKWQTIDSLASWHAVNMELCAELGTRGGEGAVYMGRGCSIGPDVRLRGPVVLGDNVRVGRGTHIENTVIVNNTRVGEELDLIGKAIAGPLVIDLQEEFGVWYNSPAVTSYREPEGRKALLLHLLAALGERVLALYTIMMLSPLFALIALLIKIVSPGPVFYTSRRFASPELVVSTERFYHYRPARQVPFRVFRTMIIEADRMRDMLDAKNLYGGGPFRKIENDPRVFPLGRFLRRTSLDELPLLFAVVTGQLRLVGLWALPHYEADELARGLWGHELLDLHEICRLRFEGEAGLAGLWQSRGRNNLSAEERALLDSYQALLISRARDSHAMHFYGKPRFSAAKVLRRRMCLLLETFRSVIARTGAH